jgi:V/A-type H+-transporting ATPase subunit E
MGYETLIETLLKEGENKCREMTEKAREEAESVLREVKEQADRMEQTRRESLRKEIQMKRERILNEARMEARRILMEAKQEAMNRVFQRAEERLSRRFQSSRGRDASRRFWGRLVEESITELPKDGLKAVLHEKAPGPLETILREKRIRYEKIDDPDLVFGFRLVSGDGRVALTNSYRTRLEKIRPDLLAELNALLFK